jgi:hypothetical protein
MINNSLKIARKFIIASTFLLITTSCNNIFSDIGGKAALSIIYIACPIISTLKCLNYMPIVMQYIGAVFNLIGLIYLYYRYLQKLENLIIPSLLLCLIIAVNVPINIILLRKRLFLLNLILKLVQSISVYLCYLRHFNMQNWDEQFLIEAVLCNNIAFIENTILPQKILVLPRLIIGLIPLIITLSVLFCLSFTLLLFCSDNPNEESRKRLNMMINCITLLLLLAFYLFVLYLLPNIISYLTRMMY